MNPPYFYPMMPQHRWNDRDRFTPNEIPARISAAIYFLRQLDHKEMDRGGGGEVAQVIDGTELLPVEQQTRAIALDLLQRYFKGQLRPSEWEELTDLPDDNDGIDRATMEKLGVVFVDCPHCKGQTGLPCIYCRSMGKLLAQRTDGNK